MKLAELFGKGRTVFSCEVFPPKRDMPVDSIYTTLDGLKNIKPDFISVTFGAGGSKVNQTTREIASIIQNQYHIPAMAHLTCVAAGRAEVRPCRRSGKKGKRQKKERLRESLMLSRRRLCFPGKIVRFRRLSTGRHRGQCPGPAAAGRRPAAEGPAPPAWT